MTAHRMRMVAVAGSTALSLSLALAPATFAQDSPEDAIQSFMDAVVAKDFETLPGLFCEEQADQAAQFDVATLAGEMPEGIDVQSLLDAFVFDISLDTLETVSESDTEAIVHVAGNMSMDIDQEALVPFVEAIIEMSGMEADEATVDMFMSIVASEFEAQSEAIDTEITLVPGDDGWLICSSLDFAGTGMGADASPAASPDAMDVDASPDAGE